MPSIFVISSRPIIVFHAFSLSASAFSFSSACSLSQDCYSLFCPARVTETFHSHLPFLFTFSCLSFYSFSVPFFFFANFDLIALPDFRLTSYLIVLFFATSFFFLCSAVYFCFVVSVFTFLSHVCMWTFN